MEQYFYNTYKDETPYYGRVNMELVGEIVSTLAPALASLPAYIGQLSVNVPTNEALLSHNLEEENGVEITLDALDTVTLFVENYKDDDYPYLYLYFDKGDFYD